MDKTKDINGVVIREAGSDKLYLRMLGEKWEPTGPLIPIPSSDEEYSHVHHDDILFVNFNLSELDGDMIGMSVVEIDKIKISKDGKKSTINQAINDGAINNIIKDYLN